MLWRTWSFVVGAPVGALAAWVLMGASTSSLEVGALCGGLGLLASVSAIARVRDDDPARRAHLAAAASVGLLALPALGARWLGLAPGASWTLAATLTLLVLALLAAARARGPSGGLARQLLVVALVLLGGGAAVVAAGAVAAALGSSDPGFRPEWAPGIFDLDAQVATVALPDCAATPANVEVLLDRGARPRLGPAGEVVWFDAEVPGGRRQVQRLELASGRLECRTCDEPGNNWRPAPADTGSGVLFESDRHATGWEPVNSEIYLLNTRDADERVPSRRLTFSPGPDSHPLFSPGARVVVWSRGADGRYEVVLASLRSAHGGLTLAKPQVVARGGARWTAPLAWSPDARALVLAKGNPAAPRSAVALDLALGKSRELASDLAGGDSVAFDADGGFAVIAEARRKRIPGLLPGGLGFLMAPLAARLERQGSLFRESRLRVAAVGAEGIVLELGDVEEWGEPTGVTLAPEGTRVILGQRRASGEERLLLIGLDCVGAE